MTAAHILVIEDDDASRLLVAYLLDAAGYTVHVAENGAVGLELALSQPHDLILCDLQMPIMNGYQVAQTLRSHPKWQRVPLVAVTAFSMPGDREKALEMGFDDHLSKPITPETFVQQIEVFLGTASAPPPAPAEGPSGE